MKLGTMENGVRVISAIELNEHLFGEDNWKVSYKERGESIRKWIKDNNAHYYAEEKYKFSELTGIRQAKEAGKEILLVENLS